MSEGLLALGPYMVVRVAFKPATLRAQSTEPTTEPPHPSNSNIIFFIEPVAEDMHSIVKNIR